MSQRIHASMVTKRKYSFHYGIFKIPAWFYSFVPFKIATGGASILLPLYLLSLGGGASDVGVMNALASFASMTGTLFWGNLSDRTLKRRVFISLGFASTSVFLALFAIVDNPRELILVNMAYAFFLATTISVPVVLVLRSVRKTYWDYGLGKFNEISGWGWVFGLAIGLTLSKFISMSASFLLFAIISFPSILMGMKSIREIPIYINRDAIRTFRNTVIQKARYAPGFVLHMPTRDSFKKLSKFRSLYTSFFLLWIASGLYFSQVPVFLTYNGFTREEIYAISIANAALSAFMYTQVGIKLKSRENYGVLRSGLVMRLAAILAILGAVFLSKFALPLVLLSYLLAGYSWSFISISGTSIVGKLAGEKEKGTAMGTYNLVNSLGMIVGSLSSGFIVESFGFASEYSLAFIFVLLSILPLKSKAL
ncbi:MFS transporter [Palaeococcus sp. (in: euryarchaeotes)]